MFIDEIVKSMKELESTTEKCDFKAVKLAAMVTKYTNDALVSHEITPDNYNILMDRIGIIAESVTGKCACTRKKSSKT